MRIPNRIYRRSDTWYYRRRIPSAIAKLSRRKDYKFCLHVSGMREARRLAMFIDDVLDRSFLTMKKEKTPTETFIEYVEQITDEEIKKNIINSYIHNQEATVATLERVAKQKGLYEQVITHYEDDNRTLDRKNVKLEREILERDKSQVDYNPSQKLKPLKISKAIEKHLEWEKGRNLDYKTMGKKVASLKYMLQILGDKHVHEVDTDDAEKVVLTIKKLPRHMHSIFKTDNILEGIKLNEEAQKPTIKPKTIGDGYITFMGYFFKEMKRKRATSYNPFETLTSKIKDGASTYREPYTIEQLNTLFSDKLFDEEWGIHQWMLVLGTLTGARTNELLQLRYADIVMKHGKPHFFIIKRDTDSDKSLKTANSRRFIPFHKLLLDLGFLDYVNQKKELGHDRIFHEEETPTNEELNFSNNYSKTIIRILRKILGKEDDYGTIVYYRLRHTFIEMMRESGTDPHHQYYYVGHKSDHIGAEYGRKGDISAFMTNAFDGINFHQIEALTKHIKKA